MLTIFISKNVLIEEMKKYYRKVYDYHHIKVHFNCMVREPSLLGSPLNGCISERSLNNSDGVTCNVSGILNSTTGAYPFSHRLETEHLKEIMNYNIENDFYTVDSVAYATKLYYPIFSTKKAKASVEGLTITLKEREGIISPITGKILKKD